MIRSAATSAACCRSPQLAGAQHDVDPTRLHTLGCEEFWQAFERRYGANPHLVGQAGRSRKWSDAAGLTECSLFVPIQNSTNGRGQFMLAVPVSRVSCQWPYVDPITL